jgi:hypothetical protein
MKTKSNHRKINQKVKTIKNRTPKDIQVLSSQIYDEIKTTGNARGVFDFFNFSKPQVNYQPRQFNFKKKIPSYTPTINDELVTLKSIPRENLRDCNNTKAFKLKEPLKIAVQDGNFFGKKCLPYSSKKSKKILLHNLSANKHVDPSKIVPPMQVKSNCWFNVMFATLFISDKGRKFFHYFRQLMIEGKQSDGTKIPTKLANAFALLNFSIESSLLGSSYAYELDTNKIIQEVYKGIPTKYKKKYPYLVDVDKAGNPIRYYGSIVHYLHNTSIELMFLMNVQDNWLTRVDTEMRQINHKPHVIILEIFDAANKQPGYSGLVKNKQTEFSIHGANYVLDSCVIRDMTQQHFCATLTCEGREMAYDGMSYHRIVPMEWKKYINTNFTWSFDGSYDEDWSSLKWSFLHGYQMLIYYRV